MSRPAVAYGDPVADAGLPGGVAEALVQAVERFPAGRFIFIDDKGDAGVSSYPETLDRALRALAGLRCNGFRTGDPVILYLASCADFVVATWAVLLGGGVLVPLARREGNRRHARTAAKTLQRLQDSLGSPWLITDAVAPASARALCLATLGGEQPAEPAPAGELDDPRVMVLTSGTTTIPRLVVLSERAVLSRWWARVPAADQAVTFMTWSPFDHVMGLGVASPNLPQKLWLAPDRFAAAPTSWLDAIEAFGVTHATMTSSGLAMITAELSASPDRSWDLSSLRKLGVGAEAVSPRTCRRFMTMTARFGLAPDAMILGYGLTECGPVVGGEDCFVPADGAQQLVALDRPTRGHAVRIVGVDDHLAPEGEVGAVQVRGPTMTIGYHDDEAATRALFTPDGWVRTGDLGLLHDGRLTITGREKEQISIYGSKYASTAIEAVAEQVEGVEAAYAAPCRDRRPGRSDVEHFALFVTPADGADKNEVATRVLDAVAAEFGQPPTAVVLIEADAVPRTSSGKVQRKALADQLDEGRFDRLLAEAASISMAAVPVSERERGISALWAQVLGSSAFGLDDDFFTAGGDSVAAVRMVLAIEEAFETRLPLDVLHERTTIRALAAHLDGRGSIAPLPADLEARQRALTMAWGGETVEPDGLVRGVNRTGAARPWFWCIQEGHEMHDLARAVGAEHPLYAMRSGHLVMDYSPATTAALASRYLREILAVDPAGPYLVGGECQGSILAHEIARQLQASGRVVALLALVDTGFWDIFGGRPYPGRVACFAGVRSRFNPLRKFRSPERGWRKLLPAGVRFALLPADHLEIFVEPSAPELAAQLRACTEWALASPAVPSGAAAGALPLGAYLPEIAAPASLTLAVGAEHVVSLRIRNSGAVDWPADAGIALGNHWLRSDGEVAVWADGRCDLAEAIPAGASASFELRIRAPAEPGRYLIEFDLVEEGVAWFKDKAGKSAFTEALVAPQRRFSLLRPSSWLQPASPPPSSRPVDIASGS